MSELLCVRLLPAPRFYTCNLSWGRGLLDEPAPLFVFLIDAAPLSQGVSFDRNVALLHGATAQQLFFVVTNNMSGVRISTPRPAASNTIGTWLAQGQGVLAIDTSVSGSALGRLLSGSFAAVELSGDNTRVVLSTP